MIGTLSLRETGFFDSFAETTLSLPSCFISTILMFQFYRSGSSVGGRNESDETSPKVNG